MICQRHMLLIVFSYILVKFFNMCLRESCFPDCWEVSLAVPVLNNVGEKCATVNYRPVSLLSVGSKVFEELINNKTYWSPREMCAVLDRITRGHLLSTYAKVSQKLTFLTPWYVHKNSSSVDLQNWFENLIVTKVNEIEIHESQNHTPTNHHKCWEITNTKSKSRVEKNNSHSIHPSNAITANEINIQSKNSIRTVPGYQSYASTIKHGKKNASWAIVINEELKRIYLIFNKWRQGTLLEQFQWSHY